MSVRQFLISMGYREEKPGKWLKPIGFCLFSFEEDRSEWTNWFRSADNGQPAIWESKKIDTTMSDRHLLITLKTLEACTHLVYSNGDSEFQLKAIDL